MEELKLKLVKTFNAKHLDKRSEVQRLEVINANLSKKIAAQVDAVIDPSNDYSKNEITKIIKRLQKNKRIMKFR